MAGVEPVTVQDRPGAAGDPLAGGHDPDPEPCQNRIERRIGSRAAVQLDEYRRGDPNRGAAAGRRCQRRPDPSQMPSSSSVREQ